MVVGGWVVVVEGTKVAVGFGFTAALTPKERLITTAPRSVRGCQFAAGSSTSQSRRPVALKRPARLIGEALPCIVTSNQCRLFGVFWLIYRLPYLTKDCRTLGRLRFTKDFFGDSLAAFAGGTAQNAPQHTQSVRPHPLPTK